MISLQSNDGVATVFLSRPPVNAIDPEFVTRFSEVLDEIERLAPTIVVIRSDQKCFCAGADLSVIRRYFDQAHGTEAMVAYVRSLHGIFDRLEKLPAVTLACIAGPALGGGLELALACDLRIAAPTAKLGLPEARVGMIPGAGGTQRLARLCGPGVASRLILGGEVIDGREAERLGLAQWCPEASTFDAAIETIASRVAGLSRPALRASKVCILAGFDPDQNGYAMEIEVPRTLMETAEARDRVTAFFASR
jgi:enoyl-CoA hydratase/carnithine racemase